VLVLLFEERVKSIKNLDVVDGVEIEPQTANP
jgi:hypothetical protein